MRALHQKVYGDVSTFELGDLPVPTPAPSEVLIRVCAASLNPIDLKRSHILKEDNFPVVTGYDVAGIVESVGSSVTSFAPGDRVVGDVQEPSAGPKISGTVAEFCLGREHLLTRIPDGVSFIDAAALPVAVCTTIQAFEKIGLKAGDKVFISAGAGGVGIHAMQIAKSMFGVSEVATTASAGKKDFVTMYGADKVVNYKTEDAGEVLKGWADIVYDTTHESEMEKRIVKEGGGIISIVEFDTAGVTPLMLEPSGELMAKAVTLVDEGKLKVVLDSVFTLDEAVKAIEKMASGRAKGKIVVKVREE